MPQASWGPCRPPVGIDADRRLHTTVSRPADLRGVRARLRPIVLAQSAAAGPGAATDDLERILLVVEELASNGLRHGDPPVEITLCATASGWLLAVSDTAADRPPTLAVDRELAVAEAKLRVLAASRRLADRDFAGFTTEATQAAPAVIGMPTK